MKTLILAMLLTVMQAVVPVIGQTADTKAAKSKSFDNDAKKQQEASPGPVTIHDVVKTPKQNQETTSKHCDNQLESVKIAEPVAVSVKPGWLDYLVLVLDLGLVIVGAAYVIAAFRTLGAIKRQADIMERQTEATEVAAKATELSAEATKKSAGAIELQSVLMTEQTAAAHKAADAAHASFEIAKTNIDLFVNKERARLRVEPLEFSPWKPIELQITGIPGVGTAPPVKANLVRYKVSFHAPTPAFISESGVTVAIFESREAQASYAGLWKMIGLPEIISPDTKLNEFAAFPQGGLNFDIGNIEKIKSKQAFIHFYGFINYKDIFDVARETRFHFRWEIILGVVLNQTPDGEWVKCGLPDDNQVT